VVSSSALAGGSFIRQAETARNPESRWDLELRGNHVPKLYDHMATAVSKLLSVGSILSSPVVVKEVLYVGSTDGNLYALD
jgi:hypothetical protein